MKLYRNHCWCSQSIWTNSNYDCTTIVSIDKFLDEKPNIQSQDWQLIEEILVDLIDPWMYEDFIKTTTEENAKKYAKIHKTLRLKTHVIEWLTNNVKDQKNEKGWCIGNDFYNGNSISSFKLFFKRKNDALKFISIFGEHNKPIEIVDRFTDSFKKLDIKTLKYNNINKNHDSNNN